MANNLRKYAMCNAHVTLPSSEYVRLLSCDTNDFEITSVPAVGAKPGELYIYYNTVRPHGWKADGYRWRDNGKFVTREKLTIKYYKPPNGDGFMRKVYWMDGSFTPVVIHYTGAIENVEQLFQGNVAKHIDYKFIRTVPSQIEHEKSDLTKNPSPKYIRLAAAEDHPVVVSVKSLRNKKQVPNTTANQRDRGLPSREDILGVREVYKETGGFLAFNSAPEFFVVFCSEGSTELFEKAAKLDGCILFYDTTFNIGDFYVSPLTYHHPVFKPKPVVPLAYLIHRSKTAHVQMRFFWSLKNALPVVANCVIVTDRDQAICEAISDEIPTAKHFVGWNHLQRDVKSWAKKHESATPGDETYSSDVWDLLSSGSEAEYFTKKNSIEEHWSQAFSKYFDEELSADIVKSGKWALKAAKVYSEGTGITSNSDERFSAVLKRCTEQKDMQMSVFLLCVYKIDLFYQKEIIRGTCGLGEYKLSAELKNKFLIDPGEATFPTDTVLPLDQIPQVFLDLRLEPELPDDTEELTSTQALVKSYIRERRVLHAPELQAFNVRGWRGNHVVTLFPNESCSCGDEDDCIHVKAVRYSVGLPLSSQN